MVGIAQSAQRWISAADDVELRRIRLECVISVAPRSIRDHGTAEALLQQAAQAEIWALGKGSTPSPAGNQKSRNTSLHAQKLRQEHGACPLPQGSEFAPK